MQYLSKCVANRRSFESAEKILIAIKSDKNNYIEKWIEIENEIEINGKKKKNFKVMVKVFIG